MHLRDFEKIILDVVHEILELMYPNEVMSRGQAQKGEVTDLF